MLLCLSIVSTLTCTAFVVLERLNLRTRYFYLHCHNCMIAEPHWRRFFSLQFNSLYYISLFSKWTLKISIGRHTDSAKFKWLMIHGYIHKSKLFRNASEWFFFFFYVILPYGNIHKNYNIEDFGAWTEFSPCLTRYSVQIYEITEFTSHKNGFFVQKIVDNFFCVIVFKQKERFVEWNGAFRLWTNKSEIDSQVKHHLYRLT